MRVLFVGADVGGCRALEPVIDEVRRRGHEVLVADHGYWRGVPGNVSDEAASSFAAEGSVDVFAFSTSVGDPFPLRVARLASASGLATFCLLDSWVNYRRRLETDGRGLFLPTRYALMDEEALREAVAEGLPSEILAVTGQPAFAALKRVEAFSCGSEGRCPVLFASEPVEGDQGGDASSETYRGYTEKDVFPLLCRLLQPFAGDVFLRVAPHPREDPDVLTALWHRWRGSLSGQILAPGEGRSSAFSACGVAGMASILLYEAWLLGLPVLSLQPGARRRDLTFILRQPGLFGTDAREEEAAKGAVASWVAALRSGRKAPSPELERHRSAAGRCADLLESLATKG